MSSINANAGHSFPWCFHNRRFLKISIYRFTSFEPDDYSSPVEIPKRSFWIFLKLNFGIKVKNTLETSHPWDFGKIFNRGKIWDTKLCISNGFSEKVKLCHMYLTEGPILYTAIFSRLVGRYCFGYLRKAIQLLI